MRILLVDDDLPYAIALQGILQTLEPSFEVDCTATTFEARKMVRADAVPFDVFLLDHGLRGSDANGVQLMEELFTLSPGSDAILLTGRDDPTAGQLAIEKGAYLSLNKPFVTRELVHILRSLNNLRIIKAEAGWLHELSDIANEMQNATSVGEVADMIVQGGLRFGFQRARLWLYVDGQAAAGDEREVIGVAEAGHTPTLGISELRRPLSRMIFAQQALLDGRPHFFHGRDLGPGGADDHFAARGVLPPAGEWVELPIVNDAGGIGTLALDKGPDHFTYQPHQREVLTEILRLFGKQAGLALERAKLHEELSRQADEARILSQIGRRVTESAATDDLTTMLDDLRRQLHDSMALDVTNFMVVLLDEDSGYLDFRRQYEEGRVWPRHWRKHPAGLCSKVIQSGEDLFLPHGSEELRRGYGEEPIGKLSRTWLGVPLLIDGKTVGVIAVQDYDREAAYTEQQKRILSAVAYQVAGAIHAAYRWERGEERDRQINAANLLRKALPQLIRQSPGSFWHALLTAITHRDGFSLNRAVLFRLTEPGDRLQGRMAVGYLRLDETHHAWEADEENAHSLEGYLEKPYLALDKPTPLQQRVSDWVLAVDATHPACYQAWTQLRRVVLPSTELAGCLPPELLNPPDRPADAPGFECGLLPLKLSNSAYGLLVVDNVVDGEPLRRADLERLEALLDEAGRIWEQYRETAQVQALGDDFERILNVGRKILPGASSRSLRESLEMVCHEAREITAADSVVIYPFRPLHGGYDLEGMAQEGLSSPDQLHKVKNKPRQRGITFMISQSGTLAVPDVDKPEQTTGGRRLSEHAFVQREQIKAMIGVPMHQEETGEAMGVVYFNYLTRQQFTQAHIARAEHIAQMAATCIFYVREIARGRKATREVEAEGHQRVIQLVNNILSLAQAPDTDEKKIIWAILQNTWGMFDRSVEVTLGVVEWQSAGETRERARRDYSLGSALDLRSRLFKDPARGLLGKAIDRGTVCRDGRQLAWPIFLESQPIGALLLENQPRQEPFTDVQEAAVRQVATVAGVALENVRGRVYLQTASETMSKVSDPTGLKDTLQGVIDLARKVAPDIDCVTLWYEDAEDRKQLIAGPSWGVLPDRQVDWPPTSRRVVRRVMKRGEPVFAPVAEKEECLEGAFIGEQQLVSVAAFPLMFGDNRRPFGALFLNYRQPHEFIPTELTLFPFFANAAAAAIHDAQVIDEAKKGEKRLLTALKIGENAGSSHLMDEALRPILATLHEAFSRGRGGDNSPYIMLYNEFDESLELHPVSGEFYKPSQEYEKRARLSLRDAGISTHVARRALEQRDIYVENVPNVRDRSDYVELHADTRSEIVAGLFSNDHLLGVLVIKSTKEAAFDEGDKTLFALAAQQVTIALERIKHAAKLQRRSLGSGALAWAAEVAHDMGESVGLMRALTYHLRESEPNLSPVGIALSEEVEKAVEPLAQIPSIWAPTLENFPLTEMIPEEVRIWLNDKGSNVQIDYEVEAHMQCNVYADRMRIWFALRRLLVNAIEAMEATELPRIIFRIRPGDARNLELQVEDTGPGVPEEVRQRLLREQYTTKESGNRVRGKGLLIAQELIESMDGSIYLYPFVAGRGAVFGIRLPLATTQTVDEENHDNH